jgi:hypothetical protein
VRRNRGKGETTRERKSACQGQADCGGEITNDGEVRRESEAGYGTRGTGRRT